MPTWSNDLPPMTLSAAGGSSISVAGLDVYNAYAGDTVFKALMIVFNDGSQQFLQIDHVYSSGLNSIVQCAGGVFAHDVSVSTVQMISWMPVCRFASDAITSEWITNTVAQSQLNVVTLEDLTPEV
jgi:hypothetical protein